MAWRLEIISNGGLEGRRASPESHGLDRCRNLGRLSFPIRGGSSHPPESLGIYGYPVRSKQGPRSGAGWKRLQHPGESAGVQMTQTFRRMAASPADRER